VKSQDTAAATADLKAHLPADVPIFCFQNGTRNEEVVARIFSQVYGGLVLMAMRYVAPGQVTHLLGKTLALGQYPEGLDGRAKAVGAALGTAGFKVVPHRRVMALKWTKLIANSANAVYALIGMPVIEACNLPKVQTYVADLWDEGMDVLDAAHITYEPFPNRPGLRELAERLRHAGPAQPPPDDADFSFYPSTWQDLDLRRGTTELKYLNGELVALGERFGVPAPLNSLLETLVEDMAARGERPGKYSLEQLQALSARVRRV
jgi:2-dehydropantoate 2-reductase